MVRHQKRDNLSTKPMLIHVIHWNLGNVIFEENVGNVYFLSVIFDCMLRIRVMTISCEIAHR